jgi:hypothetical protein
MLKKNENTLLDRRAHLIKKGCILADDLDMLNNAAKYYPGAIGPKVINDWQLAIDRHCNNLRQYKAETVLYLIDAHNEARSELAKKEMEGRN